MSLGKEDKKNLTIGTNSRATDEFQHTSLIFPTQQQNASCDLLLVVTTKCL